MGASSATVTGIPVEVVATDDEPVLGRVTCRITARSVVAVAAVEVWIADVYGAGAWRPALGVSVPGMLEPAARVRVGPNEESVISVWFEPIALGTTARFEVSAVLTIDGERRTVTCAARVMGRRATGTGSYPG